MQLFSATYEVCYDLNMSPYAGGEDLLFAEELVELATQAVDKRLPENRFLGILSRSCQLGALYLPLNIFTSTVQHEVFGHGYRIRSINHGIVDVIGYCFSSPPPYGPLQAATHFSFNPERITTTDLSSIAMAGFEAQNILAMQTRFKWLEKGDVDALQAVLYLVSLYAIGIYADASVEEELFDGHDLIDYTIAVNHTYTASSLCASTLQKLSWINLLDPYTYYALFAWSKYLALGKQTPLPMIPIGDYGYLFNVQLGLTPFGPEYTSYHYLVKNHHPLSFYIKGGAHAKNIYFGLGCYVPSFWTHGKVSLGARVDLWRQPQLLLFPGNRSLLDVDFRAPLEEESPLYTEQEQQKRHYGIAASGIVAYSMNQIFGVKGEFGYKTSGFLPGYSLVNSPVVRISGTFQF